MLLPIISATFIILLVLLFILVLIVWAHQLYYGIVSDRIVFFPTSVKQVDKDLCQIVNKYIPDTENYELVDLGCGTAHLLRFLGDKFVWAKKVGVELDYMTMVVAKFLSKGKNIEIVHDNIFTHKMVSKSLVYCFLGSEIMTKLYSQNQFQNHLVVSLSFPIYGLTPTETIDLKGFSFQRQIFVYDFRK